MSNPNACRKCRAVLTAAKAAYVFPQTSGMCWTCHDQIADARHLARQTPKKRQEIAARQAAIAAVTDAEINLHCQFGGLPKIGRSK